LKGSNDLSTSNIKGLESLFKLFSFSLREKVPAEQGDEGVIAAIRTSSVAFGDTFSLKEKDS